MAKGSSSKAQDGSQTAEEKSAELESKRLRELAVSHGLLLPSKANAGAPLRPNKGVIKCDGKDIVKKGHRKNKYLFAFPGLVAPVAGGKFGDLSHLDSRNPILYIDFPQGRLKLFGTIIYPKNKYLTLNFSRGAGNIHCEDCFESLVVFPTSWWIGTKEENPDELRLQMPQDLQQEKHAVFDFTAGAGKASSPTDIAEVPSTQVEPEAPKSPKGQLKMDPWLVEKKPLESDMKLKRKHASESESDEDDVNTIHLGDMSTPVRQSARTAGKKYTYTESLSEEEDERDCDSDDERDGDSSSDSLEVKQKVRVGAKTVNKLFTSKEEDDVFLVPESQASKKDVAGPSNGSAPVEKATLDVTEDVETVDLFAASQTSAARSSAGGALHMASFQAVSTPLGGSKQSSLSAFFLKSSEKDKEVIVEQSLAKMESGSNRKYTRKKITKSIVDKEEIADLEVETPAPKAKKASAPRKKSPESKIRKQNKRSLSEEKQNSKGHGEQGKSPTKRRKVMAKESQSKEQPILVSDDSDAC